MTGGGVIRILQSFMGRRENQVNFNVTQAKCLYDCLCRRRLKRSLNDRYPTV